MSETNEMMTLQDADFELLMLHADGELPAERVAAATQLLAECAAARAIWQDLQTGRDLLRAIAEDAIATAQSKQARVDLSLLPGQILRKLPEDAAPRPVATAEPESGLVAWLRNLGIGKVGLAMGMAAAAVALMVAKAGPVAEPPQPAAQAEMAAVPGSNVAAPDGNPSVIIEEMEIDSGTLMVNPPEVEGGSTVIWHFQDNSAPQGAGGEG